MKDRIKDDIDAFRASMDYIANYTAKDRPIGTQVKREYPATPDAADAVQQERQAEHAQSQALPQQEAETGGKA